MQLQAVIFTTQACAYIAALCMHFTAAHELAAERPNKRTGLVSLPGGACLLQAEEDRLIMELQAPADDSTALANFLARHIARLPGGRELKIIWRQAAGFAPTGETV